MVQYLAKQEENVSHLLMQKKKSFSFARGTLFPRKPHFFFPSALLQLHHDEPSIAPLPAPVADVSTGGVVFGDN